MNNNTWQDLSQQFFFCVVGCIESTGKYCIPIYNILEQEYKDSRLWIEGKADIPTPCGCESYYDKIVFEEGSSVNKIVKRVLMFVIPVVVFVLGLLVYSYFPLLTMRPAGTGPVAGGDIYAIKVNINSVYFVRTEAGYIMFDAGMDAAGLEGAMLEAGIGVDDVKWVLLTHSDYDHVAALPLFSQADIYMSEEEVKLINGLEKRSNGGGNSLPEGVDVGALKLLQDGQELMCGGTRVECVLAQGHTIGSMVYRVDGRFLFTGDAFKVSGGTAKVHPYSMNNTLSKETMGRLKGIMDESEFVLTAHYGIYTDIMME